MTSDNKYIILGLNDGKIKIWNFFEKIPETVIDGHSCIVTSLAVTSDGKYLISGF